MPSWEPQLATIQQKLEAVTKRGYVILSDGSHKSITGAVTVHEGVRMARQIMERGFLTTLETGVAFGVSTLAICLALEEAGQSTSVHFGVDPDQTAVHKGAALSLLQEHGIAHRFQLLEGCTHEVLPSLLARGVKIDFAFVDGWHTFDYTLLDFFYVDKLLRSGGLVSFHDCHYGGVLARAKRKVINFALSHRHYRLLSGRRLTALLRTEQWSDNYASSSFSSRIMRSLNVRLETGNLLTLKRLDLWEPNYDYFAKF
jgi:predicted O-methyltransferase YrrM